MTQAYLIIAFYSGTVGKEELYFSTTSIKFIN